MKRIALSLLVFGAAFACGGGHDGFEGNETPIFGTDGGADAPTSCEGTVRCSRDLRSIVDGCDGSRVVTTCAPAEGCGDGKCLPACDAAVGANATMGCEFVALPAPTERYSAGSCFAAVLTNTWGTPARIEAEYDGQPLDIPTSTRIVRTDGATTTYEPFSGEIQPGEVAAIFLSQAPSGATDFWVPCPTGTTPALLKDTAKDGTRRAPTFRVKTTAPVSAYSLYPFGGASSAAPTATLLLPLASWKTDYIVTSPREAFLFADTTYFPTTQIVAAEDNTEISIVGSVHIAEGLDVESAEKGVAKKYLLRRGEQIQFSQQQDLTGTRIGANKPIGVWVGHSLMWIPTPAPTGDSSQTALFPVRAWGREYVLAPYISRSVGEVPEEYLYRITGAVDGTTLTYEPRPPQAAPASLAAGESILFSSREPFVVKSQDSEHPFAVFAYMTGFSFAKAPADDGDPEFLTVIPTEQYLGRYVFFVDTKYPNSHLVVVRSREEGKEFQPVVFDCTGPLEGWTPIGTSGKHEFTRIWLTRRGKPQVFPKGTCGSGRHEIESAGPIAVTVWGTDQYASYAYPGGAALRTLNSVETIVK